MRITSVVLLLLGVGTVSIRGDCWWTGCQPDHWAVKGCDQYDRDERGREACSDNGSSGYKYHCCARNGGGGNPPQPPPPSGGQPFVSYDQFSRACTDNGYPAPSQDHYNNFNNYGHSVGRLASTQEAAMALAQFLHESGGFRYKREIACEQTGCPNNYRKPECDAPGQYYYGRGFIQLTWCDNYKAASRSIFGDDRLVNDADQVARDDSIAWRTSFWYWSERVRNQPGVQQGQFGATTNAINGPIECSGPGHQTPPVRFRIYGKVRAAFGLPGPGDPSGCA